MARSGINYGEWENIETSDGIKGRVRVDTRRDMMEVEAFDLGSKTARAGAGYRGVATMILYELAREANRGR